MDTGSLRVLQLLILNGYVRIRILVVWNIGPLVA